MSCPAIRRGPRSTRLLGEVLDRTLLLTSTPPGPQGVGGIILNDLLRLADGTPLVVCVVDVMPSRAGEGVEYIAAPFGRHPAAGGGSLRGLLSMPRQQLSNRLTIAAAMRAIAGIASGRPLQQIWAVLDGPQILEIALPLSRRLGLPLRVMVWDDVRHNNIYFGLDRLTRRRQERLAGQTIRAAIRCAVIGEAMQSEYRSRYGVDDAVVLRHGIDAAEWKAGRRQTASANEFQIGFAGTVTSKSAFDCFLKALDHIGWSVGDKKIRLKLLGPRFDVHSSCPRDMKVLGWRTVGETIAALSECDLVYLPQPFERAWEAFARWSFPSKLSTNLASGVPNFVHVPEYGSLVPFVRDRGVGFVCTSLDVPTVASSLMTSAQDADGLALARKRVLEVRESEFSSETSRSRFAEFLDVSTESTLG